TSPCDLFRRQRTRTFWIGSVIGASFLAALAGLFAAARSFSRQQQLAEMKTNFVSSVSHELRAPIASVRLLAESLERGNVSESTKQNQYYRFIGQECRRLSALIENVLDFSRIEQGRKQYEFEPTDVLALVGKTMGRAFRRRSRRRFSSVSIAWVRSCGAKRRGLVSGSASLNMSSRRMAAR